MKESEELEQKVFTTKLRDDINILDYSSGKERDLISKVKSGDVDKSREALLALLQEIYELEHNNLPIIKARVVELVVVLSRATVDLGVYSQDTVRINTDFIQNISKVRLISEINITAIRALDKFLQIILASSTTKKNFIVALVKEQILNNFYRPISLEEIAGSIGYSPYYVSRVFKEKEGITIQEYLPRVRVNKAKELLVNPRYNIYEVSRKVGYKDSSYFSKVFQRVEGISPSQFRAKEIFFFQKAKIVITG